MPIIPRYIRCSINIHPNASINGRRRCSGAGRPRAVTRPRLPQIRTCPIQASGSSDCGFAAKRRASRLHPLARTTLKGVDPYRSLASLRCDDALPRCPRHLSLHKLHRPPGCFLPPGEMAPDDWTGRQVCSRPRWFASFTLPWAMSRCRHTPRRVSRAPGPDGGARHCRTGSSGPVLREPRPRPHRRTDTPHRTYTPPQPFHEHIIHPTPFTVHAEPAPAGGKPGPRPHP